MRKKKEVPNVLCLLFLGFLFTGRLEVMFTGGRRVEEENQSPGGAGKCCEEPENKRGRGGGAARLGGTQHPRPARAPRRQALERKTRS